MKRIKLTGIATTLCLLGLINFPVYADTPANDAQLINALNKRTDELEQQVQLLQAQLKLIQAAKSTQVSSNGNASNGSKSNKAVKYTPQVVYKNPNGTTQTTPPSSSSVTATPMIGDQAQTPIQPGQQSPQQPIIMNTAAGPRVFQNRESALQHFPLEVHHPNPGVTLRSLVNNEQKYNVIQAKAAVINNDTSASATSTNASERVTPNSDTDTIVAKLTSEPYFLLGKAPLLLGGMPVVTSPYLGTRSAFDGTDLISFLPNINEGMHLLEERLKIDNVFRGAHEDPVLDNPYVDLSGSIQPVFIVGKPYAGNRTSTFDVPTAYLQPMANISKWVTAFMSINLDNTAPGQFLPQQFGPLVNNSRVFMDQAFVTIGNLYHSPFYATIGQMYVPFGLYNTNMVSAPLTLNLFRTKARALVFGFDATDPWPEPIHGLDAQVFAFRGNTVTSLNGQSKINNYGANADYTWASKCDKPKLTFSFGGSYIANVADATGMQLNGANTGFEGFAGENGVIILPGTTANPELLQHRVPGVDGHGSIGIGDLSFVGEYITATSSFSQMDLTYKDHGAKPSAAQVEGIYNFTIYDRPTNIALGYQLTNQALALLEPQKRYTATLNTSIWKDTIESLEFRHDVNYPLSAYASGAGVPLTLDGIGLGQSSNTVTFQIAAFF